jgi:hypothetical protein
MLDDRLHREMVRQWMKPPSKVLLILERIGWFPSLTKLLREREELRQISPGKRLLFVAGVVVRSTGVERHFTESSNRNL